MAEKAFAARHRKADLADALDSAGPLGWPIVVGQKYLIRGVAYHWLGKVVAHNHACVVLEGGWLADSGRFGECLRTGCVNEFEPIPGQFAVNVELFQEVIPWSHAVPAEAL